MEQLNLNIIPGKTLPVCHVSQYDVGRSIRINLFDGVSVYTLTGAEDIELDVKKPDGNIVTVAVTNTSASYVDFATTEQMTACSGSNLCELRIKNGGDDIGTLNFIMECEKSPLENGVESDSNIHNLQTQVHDIVTEEIEDITSKLKNLCWITNKTNRSVNGLDISFNQDGSITVSGTATALTIIYLRGATSNVANLPAGEYTITRWTVCGSGNLRVTNNGTNLISSNSTDKQTITQTFATAPQLYLSVGNGVTVKGTFKIQIEAGGTGTEYEIATPVSARDDIARFNLTELEEKIYFRHTTTALTQGGTNRVQILLGGIVRYDLVHSVVNDTHCDCWRILAANASNDRFDFVQQLTASGEWECALRLAGRDDFSGGYLHGDEVMDSIRWFADGQEISDISQVTSITPAKELRIVETSDLLDPSDHTTVIAKHGKEYIFNKDGLVINQSVEWKVSDTLDRCYLAMFPASKSMTSELYVNSEFVIHQLNETSYSHEIKQATDAILRGNHMVFDFGVGQYPGDYPGGNTFLYTDNSGNSYNKCYYRICSGGSISTGDIWVSQTKYKIRFNY